MRTPAARFGWVALAGAVALLAAYGIASVSSDNEPTPVKAAGPRSTGLSANPPISAPAPAISLPEGMQISSVEIADDKVWLAVAQNGEGSLLVLRTNGEELQRIALAGEVPVNGLHLVGNQLVFPVIDELGTTGTGVYAVDLGAERPTAARIAPLDRAVDTGTDGTNLWLRGEGLAARVSVATGEVANLPVTGFGWIDGEGRTAWATDRDSQRVLKFEGPQLVAQMQLATPGRVLATAAGVYVTTGSRVTHLDRDLQGVDETVALSEPAIALNASGKDILALGEHSLTKILPNGDMQRLPIDIRGPATAVAVDRTANTALVCAAGSECAWTKLS